MKKSKKVFRSRISVLLIGCILAIFIPVSVSVWMITPRINESIYILGASLLFVIFIFSGMRYIISENRLYAKIWMIPFGSVKIADIASVKRSYNPISSPAASLKRLHLCFANRRFWLISPVREQEFIEELKSVNPDIMVNVPEKKGLWRIWDWDI
ncbi:MAG: PH domain-containing protein [Tannerella sp.]|jgi:hypothetical protein|nr:PH domain-containing protein [Tannerella sp.]